MTYYSTHQAAKKLGITQAALSKYIKAKKVPAPKSVTSGKMTLHLWTEKEIQQLQQLLPKIANGRKTRHQKSKQKAQAKSPVPRKPKKK
ncbi:MAG: hypothetical protein LAO78_05980 [Acidobacteriia bacterium]|nr:hypothetical protein [Terriglobia bacterium]